MIPVQFPESNAVLAMGQDDYEPLAIYRFEDAQGRVAFCCRLTEWEVDEIRRTRTIWIQQLTFGHSFQPIALSTQRPDDLPLAKLRPMNAPTCVHPDFEANVAVNRFEDSGGFMAEVRIICRECKQAFRFLGLLMGLHFAGATVNADGTEARLAICPANEEPKLPDVLGFSVKAS